MICLFLIIISCSNVVANLTVQTQSSYSQTGLCTTGKLQSPINIIEEQLKLNCSLINFKIFSINQSVEARITRNLQFLLIQTPFLFSLISNVDNEGNRGVYMSNKIRIYWPAEHQIDHKRYNAEIQIIYQLSKQYEEQNWQKQLIVSVLFNKTQQENIHTFFDEVELIDLHHFQLNLHNSLLTQIENSNFFYYQGSKILDSCEENVNWFVSEIILGIKGDDLNILQSFSSGKPQNRQIKQLNKREIYKINNTCNNFLGYFDQTTQQKYGYRLNLSIMIIILISFIFFY